MFGSLPSAGLYSSVSWSMETCTHCMFLCFFLMRLFNTLRTIPHLARNWHSRSPLTPRVRRFLKEGFGSVCDRVDVLFMLNQPPGQPDSSFIFTRWLFLTPCVYVRRMRGCVCLSVSLSLSACVCVWQMLCHSIQSFWTELSWRITSPINPYQFSFMAN